MIILGMHFGHDASVSIIRDGQLVSHVLVERHLRTKQAVGIRTAQLDAVLADAKVQWQDIDICTVVSTQDLEILTGLIDEFSIQPGETASHPVRSPFAELLRGNQIDVNRLLTANLNKVLKLDGEEAQRAQIDRWKFIFPEWQSVRQDKVESLGWMNLFTTHDRWAAQRTLEQIASDPVDPATFSDAVRLGMHYPVTVSYRGVSKPGYFIDHHVCHAASAHYRSGFERSAIITHDGGDAARGISGHLCFAENHRLYVLGPHHLALGGIYRATGIELGFDLVGAEGKLMGLSSYGKPRFFNRHFIGNCFDLEKRFAKKSFAAWFDHCESEGRARGYEVDFGRQDTILNEFSKDVAASTQYLFEENFLQVADMLYNLLAGIDRRSQNLCLSGGAALNCPSNSRIFMESAFTDIYIDPNCDDGGLSIGAALYCYHNMLDNPLIPELKDDHRSPYKGVHIKSSEIEQVLDEARREFQVLKDNDPARMAAQDIADNKILAWFEGRSEMGPRALCHRSLLANPQDGKNWRHVNAVKGREAWRPLAPVVPEDDMENWFADCPAHSPYMLFTARVTSDSVPAITHVDGSARIQTVDKTTGLIYLVLKNLGEITGCSVAINTSLNRRGEPIVETPAEALTLFRETEVDILYLDGWRISRD